MARIITYGDGVKQVLIATTSNTTFAHNIGVMTKTVFMRMADAIGTDEKPASQADIIRAFKPQYKISQSSVSKWANGGFLQFEKAIYFCQRYNVCVEWLYTGRGPKHPDSARSELDSLMVILDDLDDDTRKEIEAYAHFLKERLRH